MAYERPITIMEMVDNIRRKNYVLPSIQREFAWKTDQIEQLFDSLNSSLYRLIIYPTKITGKVARKIHFKK